jgi:hypothetical protein
VASASRSARLTFTPSFNCLGIFFPVVVALLLVWVMPAQVGLWTQIRKGLPSFARAPRTIIVASCLEAHRLIYLSVLYAMWVLADMWVRTWILPWNDRCIPYMIVGLVCFGAIGWVGPLRSDYTRQLVRSRIHALRILAMYAVLLPSLVALTTQFVMRMRTVWAMY